MIKLYLLSIYDVRKIPESYCREHFPLRLLRSEKFRFEEDRLRCIGAGILLTEVLAIKEEELLTGPQGKPYVPGGKKQFSLSHSGEYIVLAVSGEETGVDIEQKRGDHSDVAKRVFQPGELDWLRQEPLNRFYTLWTLKESVMKACGMGFSLSPESFNVLPLTEGKCIEAAGRKYYGRSVNGIPGYACAVVCAGEDTGCEFFRLCPENGTFEINSGWF